MTADPCGRRTLDEWQAEHRAACAECRKAEQVSGGESGEFG
jgi:hypothetical protein